MDRTIEPVTKPHRIVFVKCHEYYEITYDDGTQRSAAIVQLCRWAENPDLSLTAEDAFQMAMAINREGM